MNTAQDAGIHPNPEAYAPISQLHSDLLWLIFMMNSYTSVAHNPLFTTRSSSQVCHQWRSLILSLPSIWGRLIHLDSLSKCSQWGDEVLSRAGSASLWVYGTIDPETANYTYSLLSKYWTRVQKLTVDVDVDLFIAETYHDTPPFGESIIQFWEVLQHPAPQLEVLKIQYSELNSSIVSLDLRSICLFDNNAPSLQELAISGIKFGISASCLSNIRSMTFTHLFNIPQIFTILLATRRIESLKIIGTSSREGQINPSSKIYGNLPALKLPQLSELTLSGYYPVILPLIEHIAPRAGCCLHLSLETVDRWRFNPSDITMWERECVEIIQRKATEYLQKYLLSHPATALSIDCRSEYFHLADVSRAFGQALAFTVDGTFNEDYGPSVIEQISRHEYLSSVTGLAMHLTFKPSYFSSISKLPPSLCSLSELETSENTLKFLVNHHPGDDSVFPLLRILKLTQLNPPSYRSRYPSQTIWDFLHQQICGGSPVTVLDLTLLPYHQLYDMEYLDHIPGLAMVRWVLPGTRSMQYECGSGKSDSLCFKKKRKAHLRRVVFEEEVSE